MLKTSGSQATIPGDDFMPATWPIILLITSRGKLHNKKSVPKQLVVRSEFGKIPRGEVKGLDCS